jgi:hypothetical protein
MTDSSDFARFPVACLTGGEQFHSSGRETGICLREFWSWSSSDLLNNTMRGVLAEFLVARATGVAEDARACWKPYDLKTARGLRIEVKSASRWQSWNQRGPSKLAFGIQPTLAWDEDSNTYATTACRQADVYVFCVLDAPRKADVDPLNLDQWRFLVVPAPVIATALGSQKTIGLEGLRALGASDVAYPELPAAIAKHEGKAG